MMQFLRTVITRYGRIMRFLIAGGTATGVDLLLLFILTDVFHVWYLASAGIAFVIAVIISFTLQKFWTFGNHGLELLGTQMTLYVCIALTGLGLNTVGMYVFVDHLHLHYLLAQIMLSACIAVMNFFAYKHLVFRGG